MSKIALLAALTLGLAEPAAAASGPPGHSHAPHGGAAHSATATDGRPGNPAEATRTVRIETRENNYSVKQIQVKAGETIRFVVTNVSYEPHEFGIASPQEHEQHRAMMKEMPDMKHDEANVVTVLPGETKELAWKFGRDGNVEFACNIPGHSERGMTGKFRVMR